MDDCACDDYIGSTGFDWDPAGGWLNVWFHGVSGADNDGTILFPLYIVEPQGFTVTFDVTETSMGKNIVEAGRSATILDYQNGISEPPVSGNGDDLNLTDYRIPENTENNTVTNRSECGEFIEYIIYQDGVQIATSSSTDYSVTGLENDTEFCFTVTASYVEGESEASNDACATPMAPSMSVSTDAISDTLMPGESSGHEFTVENTGGLPFEYAVTVAPSGVRGLLGIEIMTDNYPSETTWDLQDGDGNVIETGGPLADPATLYQWEVWLFTSGDYTWTIYDAYGDGICCAYGEGWYNLFVDGEPAGSGGEFGSSESVDLSIGEGGGGVDWLSLSAESGSLDPGEADEIEVLMNSADLEEGTYDAYIVVSTYFSEHVIAVQMVVDDGVGIADGGVIPDVFALHQNFPNPFNPVTALPYDVPEIADVKIDIYNLLGQKVRSLVTGEHEPGFYRATWNGKNDRGALVTTGVYIYQITARSNATGEAAFTETRKLVLMK